MALIISNPPTHALEVSTHQTLNERIAKTGSSEFSLETYLRDQLKFTDGVNEVLSGERALKRFLDGGKYEDQPPWTPPYLRSFNHFHNPVSDQGLGGLLFSSKNWALFGPSKQTIGGNYSWH